MKLVIFDVDGTLVDSQADIVTCMAKAFAAESLAAPARADVLSIVGLSLPNALARLAAEQPEDVRNRIVAHYKDAYADHRARSAPPTLYPGTMETLRSLHAQDDVLLGIATGKSRRGLNALLEGHDMNGMFVTKQVADDHPSKPHPSMLMTALAECGLDAEAAVMIGDTTYDMQMADAARVPFIGVSWGYHRANSLTSAYTVLDQFDDLHPTLAAMWRTS